MKYKLTKETKECYGIKLHRIEALKDFGNVKKGEKGGWIEKESNLSQNGNAWVYDNACIYGDAKVFGNAEVSGNARVYGNAEVYGSAYVYGSARVYGDAYVYGSARVYGIAYVYGNARVFGNAEVYGIARVYGDAWVYGKLKLIRGYFYHTRLKTEVIEKIELDEDRELLCKEPVLEDKEEKDDLVEITVEGKTKRISRLSAKELGLI